MSRKVDEVVKMVNDNARKHGWWETDKPFYETVALIHSELSEALEEYRNHHAMVWYDEGKYHKPEGIATEMIDAVIRIFDWIGQENGKIEEELTIDELIRQAEESEKDMESFKKMTCPEIVAKAHLMVSRAYDADNVWMALGILALTSAKVMLWIRYQGIDPETLLLAKHEYNLTRPYRHGNKAC